MEKEEMATAIAARLDPDSILSKGSLLANLLLLNSEILTEMMRSLKIPFSEKEED